MDRHAYLILAHKNPWQLKMLLESLDHELNDIYIHLDRNADFGYDALDNICTRSTVRYINPRIRIHWGGVSIIRAEMALLEEAVRTRHSYYHLLSGMDLPIKSQDTIHRFFEENNGREFLNLWTTEEHTLRRVHYYTLFPEGSRFFLTNWLNHSCKALLAALGIRQNSDVEFSKGSQWFSITHNLAQYIVSRKDWVERVFRHCTICDEFLIPTILNQSEYKNNLYCSDVTHNSTINLSNLRLIDWSRSPDVRHPLVFTMNDLEMLKTAPHFWARKFDENVDRNIIIEICRMNRES